MIYVQQAKHLYIQVYTRKYAHIEIIQKSQKISVFVCKFKIVVFGKKHQTISQLKICYQLLGTCV